MNTQSQNDLLETGKTFIAAVEQLLDWMNGNDLVSDHADQCPEDYKMLCDALPAFRSAIETASTGGAA
ncbi:hypothetical protein QFZ34_002096 [Phyllobacterium ifriqiyense]|uniref:Uncharacterized protein n=1 Tax=Phyllobacterium ifriqiyense TaxID=314238 RepID=A0ABU0S834_9HYPH|nr:hypothetical protein [Phyllobacterium ifriqiyense]MDQ0996914.1 hypothetical protein [Phyllobacterium ifriqiyense]